MNGSSVVYGKQLRVSGVVGAKCFHDNVCSNIVIGSLYDENLITSSIF